MSDIKKGFRFPAKFRDFVRVHVCDYNPTFAQEIAEHGSDYGCAYLTYTYDILKIFEQYRDEIEELISDATGGEPLSSFLDYAKKQDQPQTVSALTEWFVRFAAELECSYYWDEYEREADERAVEDREFFKKEMAGRDSE